MEQNEKIELRVPSWITAAILGLNLLVLLIMAAHHLQKVDAGPSTMLPPTQPNVLALLLLGAPMIVLLLGLAYLSLYRSVWAAFLIHALASIAFGGVAFGVIALW
jgi:hypothetical protein